MQVKVTVQGRPEALYESHGAALRFPHGAELASPPDQGGKHRFRENAKNICHHAGVVSQAVAESVRKREHPLADRDVWKDAVDQVGRSLRHSSSSTRIADTAFFAGVGYKAVQPAFIAVNANKTPQEHTAVEEPPLS
jgi:hypothetical protein